MSSPKPFRDPRPSRRTAGRWLVLALGTGLLSLAADPLDRRWETEVRPFVTVYCSECHDAETRKAGLDLERFATTESVAQGFAYWDLVLDRLHAEDMPPRKSRKQPTAEERKRVVGWLEAVREREARRHDGDPGPVPPRRLSNAEYDNTVRELTGVDLRPARNFPVDPANQAGFDNSAESLAASPALVRKHLEAAREVADHLVLQPDGLAFAPHPVVADTDRDKWSVFRIVDFYRRQPTDIADYLEAAWRHRHRAQLGERRTDLAARAATAGISARYLQTVWEFLTDSGDEVGPVALVRSRWRALPEPGSADPAEVRRQCEALRDRILALRSHLVPEVPNLRSPSIHDGAQALVLWKNRQMAANRRRHDPAALRAGDVPAAASAPAQATPAPSTAAAPVAVTAKTNAVPKKPRHVQAPTPQVVQKGGVSIPPAVVTRETSATSRMAASKGRGSDPDLVVPADPALRARHEAAFARFASVFPDAFYITERARVFLDAEQEQANAGRLLSAGFHSMTGYFRDDQPLRELVLDEAGRRELDRLWDEFDLVSSVPQRMLTSLAWFERTDSAFLRDPEFDPFRPEDQSIQEPERIRKLGALYLAKAVRNGAPEAAQAAIREHFERVEADVRRVGRLRAEAGPAHLRDLVRFAERAYRRPLTAAEKAEVAAFQESLRKDTGLGHEDAVRDGVVRVLMSPHFLFRMDLGPAAGPAPRRASAVGGMAVAPLDDVALANRLSYFLWAGPPDATLLESARAGRLHRESELKAQARRMLKDPRVRGLAVEFGANWLDFRRFEQHNGVDRGRFPAFDNTLRAAMFEEPVRLLTDVFRRDRPFADLLHGRDTFVNAPLARHYGLALGETDADGWAHVADARAAGRGGLLPMGVFLTANSPGLRTSPVKRGNWVVKRILGERIPAPPPTVPELPADEKALGERTLREALAAHRNNEACAGCHERFDSFGLAFEGYGPVGERREKDFGGRPVDARADFPGGSTGTGLEGLLGYIREHRERDFEENLCRRLVAYGLGRTLLLSDEPLVRRMRDRFRGGKATPSSLVETLVTSPQFRNRRADGTPRGP